jgi:hypothetical protein
LTSSARGYHHNLRRVTSPGNGPKKGPCSGLLDFSTEAGRALAIDRSGEADWGSWGAWCLRNESFSYSGESCCRPRVNSGRRGTPVGKRSHLLDHRRFHKRDPVHVPTATVVQAPRSGILNAFHASEKLLAGVASSHGLQGRIARMMQSSAVCLLTHSGDSNQMGHSPRPRLRKSFGSVTRIGEKL